MKVTKSVPRTSNKSKRLFHKRVIRVTILSEEPLDDNMTLSDVEDAIITGDCSGEVNWGNDLVLDSKRTVRALKAQGSDPGFFQLNDDGSDVEDDPVELDSEGHCLGGTL
jgi:hypothetical protein